MKNNLPIIMKIRVIFKFIILFLLFFYSFYSFSQTRPILQIHDCTKVCDGYILWMGKSKCTLIDRKGNTLYNIPGNISAINNNEEIISHSSGNLIAFNKSLDAIWKVSTPIHHELAITTENNIMILSDEFQSVFNNTIRFDNILCFDSSGNELFKWSTFENRRYLLDFMVKDTNIFHFRIRGLLDTDSILLYMTPSLKLIAGNNLIHELFHMNSIHEIPENESEKKDSIFRKGNLLLSFCNYCDSITSFIAIVDPIHYKILWYYVQEDRKQMHTPSMLANGNILIYVNNSSHKGDHSSIEELNPITKEIVWKYTEKYSKNPKCNAYGSCQRLQNGNTMISNCNGYIYEVTPDKRIVWQWFTSEGNKFVYRAYLYPEEKLKWLVNE